MAADSSFVPANMNGDNNDYEVFHDAIDSHEEESQQRQPRTFHQFSLLHEDLQVFILSFLAHVPFEHRDIDPLLTHTLPYVSHHFHALCQSDHLWKQALERLIVKDPALWVPGLLKLSPRVDSSAPDFVKLVHSALQEPGYMQLFKMVVARHLRFTGPVFIMSGVVRLGQGIGLHFFEPRYRTLIARVMESFPQEFREGHTPIAPNENGEHPTFIYAHMAPFAPTTPACLVRVEQCTIHANGSADVMLIPTAYVWLERLWEAPNTGRLHYAQTLRMPSTEVDRMEQETFQQHQQGFENPLIAALLQDRGLLAPPVGLEGPLRALLSYMVNEHGYEEFDNDGNEENDGHGVLAD